MNKDYPIITKYNLDSNNNPQSIALTETKQISTKAYHIVLNQIPDEFYRVTVTVDGATFTECFFTDNIANTSYKVNYKTGVVYFNPSQAGKTATLYYQGIGVEQISDTRIILSDGGDFNITTLNELITLNTEAIRSVNNINAQLDAILTEVQIYAENTTNNMLQSYNTMYVKMDGYVGDLRNAHREATRAMEQAIENFNVLAQQADESMKASIRQYANMFMEASQELTRARNEAQATINAIVDAFRLHKDAVKDEFDAHVNRAKIEIDEKKELFKEGLNNLTENMVKVYNNFVSFGNEYTSDLQRMLEEAQALVVDLEAIYKGKQLQWQHEFEESQLEKLEQFQYSTESKDKEFRTFMENMNIIMNDNEDDRQKEFDENEALREQEWEELKRRAVTEDALLQLKQESDLAVDEIEMEDVLELIRDEDGYYTGSIGGQRLYFYRNYIDEEGKPARDLVKDYLISGKQSTYLGEHQPVDVDQLWFDPSDEDMSEIDFPENYALAQFQDTVNEIRDKVSKVEQATKLDDLFAGTFFQQGSTSSQIDKGTSTVNHIRIKVGNNTQIGILKEGEMAYCVDTERLYIGARINPTSTITTNKLIGGTSAGGDSGNSGTGGNLTGEYLELDGRDGIKYRVYIDEDGNLKQRESSYFNADAPNASDAGVGARYKGLIVNRYFGGGAKDNNQAPLSHSFIELYNNNSNGQTMNLKGLCIYYKNIDDGVWRRLELRGYVPAKHSYLIRCSRVNSKANSSCRYEIKNFDQSWDMELSSTSAMVYLGVDYGQLTIPNPWHLTDGTTLNSYIDMLCGAAESEERSLPAVEYNYSGGKAAAYRRLLSQDCGIQRIDFNDTNVTYSDVEQVNYRTCDMSIYAPRCVEDGAWDLYYNKTKLNENIPNLLNIQYGKEWHTRTFTWQSKVMARGYLRYRKAGETKWNYKSTNTQIVYHIDQDCTIHRVILRNLEEGIYEYQAGDEGYWGDVSTFEVKSYQKNGAYDRDAHIKFLHVSDQQALYENDYEAWRWSIQYIEDNEDPNDYDFAINTGDISQSGNRSFEWRCYYKFPRFLKEKCHMLVCGNNDLFNKIYSNCFKYYDTTEFDFNGDTYSPNYGNHDVIQGKSPYGGYASAHSFDLGYAHFVVVNSNCIASVEDPDIFVKQMNWVRQDVQAARMRPNPPRWFIMLAHHGAFTVCRMRDPQQMIPFVEDLGFHVVICGHHHTYSRSTPIRMNIREQVEAITGHDLYEVYDGCGQAIASAVYSIGYIETFANKQGVHVLPKGVTYDQTTENGTLDGGAQGIVSNGNVGSREAYVSEEVGTMWVMAQASGAKLKSNKDLEKTPTPWYYGWCNDDGNGNYSNKVHPYKPNYLMWDISWDSISVKSYVLNGIVDYDDYLADAVMKRPDQVDYSEIEKEIIDEFTIPWRDIPSSVD